MLGSTLSSLAAVGSLRSSSLAVENRGDLLYFIESPVDMKLCMRLSTKPSVRILSLFALAYEGSPSIDCARFIFRLELRIFHL